MVDKTKVINIYNLSKEKKLKLDFVIVMEILKLEQFCRETKETHKLYTVYNTLKDNGVEVEIQDVIAILELEELVRNETLQ